MTMAVSVMRRRRRPRRSAPIGIWQPPPSRVTTARSAASAAAARGVVDGARPAPRVALVVAADLDGDDALARRRHAGLDGQRAPRCGRACSSRRRPAAASTRRRTRPRPACAAACRGCRESAGTCASGKQPRQLRDAPDAARADARRAPEHAARPRRTATRSRRAAGSTTRVARIFARQHRADLAGRRAAPPACPCCCARRDRSSPASSASSISFTNSRLPPISDERRLGQPVARRLDDDDLAVDAGVLLQQRGDGVAPETARAGCRGSRASAWPSSRACVVGAPASASSPASAALGAVSSREPEQPVDRFGVGHLRFLVGQRLELLGRLEQQLLDDQPRHLVDARARLRRQRRPACRRAAAARPGGSRRTAGAARRPSERRRATAARR